MPERAFASLPPCRGLRLSYGGNRVRGPLRIASEAEHAEGVPVDHDERASVRPADDQMAVAVAPEPVLEEAARRGLPGHVDADRLDVTRVERVDERPRAAAVQRVGPAVPPQARNGTPLHSRLPRAPIRDDLRQQAALGEVVRAHAIEGGLARHVFHEIEVAPVGREGVEREGASHMDRPQQLHPADVDEREGRALTKGLPAVERLGEQKRPAVGEETFGRPVECDQRYPPRSLEPHGTDHVSIGAADHLDRGTGAGGYRDVALVSAREALLSLTDAWARPSC